MIQRQRPKSRINIVPQIIFLCLTFLAAVSASLCRAQSILGKNGADRDSPDHYGRVHHNGHALARKTSHGSAGGRATPTGRIADRYRRRSPGMNLPPPLIRMPWEQETSSSARRPSRSPAAQSSRKTASTTRSSAAIHPMASLCAMAPTFKSSWMSTT